MRNKGEPDHNEKSVYVPADILSPIKRPGSKKRITIYN
jgi:hypothetical protein